MTEISLKHIRVNLSKRKRLALIEQACRNAVPPCERAKMAATLQHAVKSKTDLLPMFHAGIVQRIKGEFNRLASTK